MLAMLAVGVAVATLLTFPMFSTLLPVRLLTSVRVTAVAPPLTTTELSERPVLLAATMLGGPVAATVPAGGTPPPPRWGGASLPQVPGAGLLGVWRAPRAAGLSSDRGVAPATAAITPARFCCALFILPLLWIYKCSPHASLDAPGRLSPSL